MDTATAGGFDGADGFVTRLARAAGAFTVSSGAGLRVRGRGALFAAGAGRPAGGRDSADAAGAVDDSAAAGLGAGFFRRAAGAEGAVRTSGCASLVTGGCVLTVGVDDERFFCDIKLCV